MLKVGFVQDSIRCCFLHLRLGTALVAHVSVEFQDTFHIFKIQAMFAKLVWSLLSKSTKLVEGGCQPGGSGGLCFPK